MLVGERTRSREDVRASERCEEGGGRVEKEARRVKLP